MPHVLFSIIFALMAAVGNAMYALSQKKTDASASPFLFIILAMALCIVILSTLSMAFPKIGIRSYIVMNYKWIIFGGAGLALTFTGFYLLYSRFGPSYYILYAVLSIITTSVIVGVFVLKERMNIYYALSVATAVTTIILFTIGKMSPE
jgi:drug/metabolite transporter (DMT)-like permease